MSNTETIAIRAIEILRDHGIERIEKLPFDPPPTINSIVSGDPHSIITVFFPQVVDQSILKEEDLIYKSGGVLAGFSKIELIVYPGSFSAALYVSATAEEIPGTGFAEFYRAPLYDYEQMAADALAEIEAAAGYSFTSAADYDSYITGGEEFLTLPRIPINSVSVQDLRESPIDPSSIEVLHDEGMLMLKSGAYWPRGRLKVTANHGFDEIPADVINAAAHKTAAGLLQDDLKISGDVQSESATEYSYSAGPGGKYGGVQQDLHARANLLLGKYITGVG